MSRHDRLQNNPFASASQAVHECLHCYITHIMCTTYVHAGTALLLFINVLTCDNIRAEPD